MKKVIALFLIITLSICVFAACSKKNEGETTTKVLSTAAPSDKDKENDETEKEETGPASDKDHPRVKVEMDGGGEFIIELYPEYAPKTVENFLKLVNDGFYEGLTFHRVMDNFMAQGGDGSEKGREAKTIKGEFAANGFKQNTLSHTRGVISMARSEDNDSASSQFFICYSDTCQYLDGQYAAFGKVVEGMDVVDGFTKVERVRNERGELASPVDPIFIKSMTEIK